MRLLAEEETRGENSAVNEQLKKGISTATMKAAKETGALEALSKQAAGEVGGLKKE